MSNGTTAAADALLLGQDQSAKFLGQVQFPSFTVATLPSVSVPGAGSMIFVTDDAGGAVPAFSDGTNWRRVTDRLVVA